MDAIKSLMVFMLNANDTSPGIQVREQGPMKAALRDTRKRHTKVCVEESHATRGLNGRIPVPGVRMILSVCIQIGQQMHLWASIYYFPIGGFVLKRIVLLSLLILCIGAVVFSQSPGRGGFGRNQNPRGNYPNYPNYPEDRFRNREAPQPVTEKVSVTGNLTIARGILAVKNNDITYLLPGLQRFMGFIDTLKDGAQVILDGSALSFSEDSKFKVLMISKLTIGGKDYDFERPERSFQPQRPSQPKEPRTAPRPMPRQPDAPYGRRHVG